MEPPLDVICKLSIESHSSCSSVPGDPWLEKNWDQSSEAYVRLHSLYSSYFDRVHRIEGEERALVDLVLCQLNCFVGVDELLDRRLLLVLVNSYAQTTERFVYRQEFIRLMFFLSFASKEQLEEAVFGIVSGGQSRVTVGQLVQMHSYRTQRRMSVHVINLISECDRSGCGLLDVYDFRLLIRRLQMAEERQCTETEPSPDEECRRLEEALMEAQELQELNLWSWQIGEPERRSSPQFMDHAQCRALLEQHPAVCETLAKLAWDNPETLSTKFIKMVINHIGYEKVKSVDGSSVISCDEDGAVVEGE